VSTSIYVYKGVGFSTHLVRITVPANLDPHISTSISHGVVKLNGIVENEPACLLTSDSLDGKLVEPLRFRVSLLDSELVCLSQLSLVSETGMASMILNTGTLNVVLTHLLRLTMVSGQLLGSSTRRPDFLRSITVLKQSKCPLGEETFEKNVGIPNNDHRIDAILSEHPDIYKPHDRIDSCLRSSIGIGPQQRRVSSAYLY
jgi:hypothetical protein